MVVSVRYDGDLLPTSAIDRPRTPFQSPQGFQDLKLARTQARIHVMDECVVMLFFWILPPSEFEGD